MKADIIQKEVDPPANNYCSVGHIAAKFFKRSGPDSVEEPTKFFELSGKGLSGIICEPCLIIAHYNARQKKK